MKTLRLWRRDTGKGVEVWDIEKYLPHVVAHEVSSLYWPTEALKAQAVAARTYAYYHTIYPKHSGMGADLCTETCCQYFRYGTNLPALSAVDATARVVLRNKAGNIFESFYHACCGGSIPGCPCNCQRNGHGWGMCQIGAKEFALQGKTWVGILKFYYPQWYIPQEDKELNRQAVTNLLLTTEPALARAARQATLGVPATGEQTLSFEGHLIVYQWWTGGLVWCVKGDWDNVAVVKL